MDPYRSTGRPSLFLFDDEFIEPRPPLIEPLVHGTYLGILDQLAVLAQWDRMFPDWDLPCKPDDLRQARTYAQVLDDAYGWSRGEAPPAHCLVLVPYLSSVPASFRFLRARLFGSQRTYLTPQPRFDGPEADEGIRLSPRCAPVRCRLRAEMIDLAHGWAGKRSIVPQDLANHRSAHAGVLAALAIHLPLLKIFDGYRMPHLCLGGYELTVNERHPWGKEPSTGELWTHLPMLVRSAHDGRTSLIARRKRALTDRVSVPTILRSI